MENKELYERAKRRVKARMGFYTHLGIYAAVNAVLFLASFNETGTVRVCVVHLAAGRLGDVPDLSFPFGLRVPRRDHGTDDPAGDGERGKGREVGRI